MSKTQKVHVFQITFLISAESVNFFDLPNPREIVMKNDILAKDSSLNDCDTFLKITRMNF